MNLVVSLNLMLFRGYGFVRSCSPQGFVRSCFSCLWWCSHVFFSCSINGWTSMKRRVKCIRLLQFENIRRAHVDVVIFDAQQFQLLLQ